MYELEVVVAHSARVTVRVGDVFLKIDTDQGRIDREADVMARAPIPTPEVLSRKPPVLALAVVPGTALGPPRRAVTSVVDGVVCGRCGRSRPAGRSVAPVAEQAEPAAAVGVLAIPK